MQVPDSVSEIDESVFAITVNAFDPERQPNLAFVWETIEFTSEYCVIRLTFDQPLEVSSVLGPRDWLELTVIDSKRLYEQFNGYKFESIEVGTQSKKIIPP